MPGRVSLSLALTALLLANLVGLLAWSQAGRPAHAIPPHAIHAFDSSQMAMVSAGALQRYTHTLRNESGGPQTYNLSVASNQDWTVTVLPTTLALGSGQSAEVVVELSVPGDAPPGRMAVSTLTARTVPPSPPPLTVKDTALVQSSSSLKVPEALPGELIDGQRTYSLTMQRSSTEFWPGLQTPTSGYNGSFLGPTLVMTYGEAVALHVTNQLAEQTTTHWHGLHLPAVMDGGPHQLIEPGETWRPYFTLLDRASTMWYHPHPHAHEGGNTSGTGTQVYRGLAGMILVRDEASNALGLPQRYGLDEFPLIVQDRNFNPDGSFQTLEEQGGGLRKGDHFLINGTLAGILQVPAQMVRFHLLNGSNARIYNLGLGNDQPFYQIGADGGLLNEPFERTRLHLGPGERAEIVVDLAAMEGQTIHVVSYNDELQSTYVPNPIADDFDRANFILFTLDVTAQTADPITSLPATLNDVARLDSSQAGMRRTLTLTIPPSINNTTFDMEVVNITTTLGTLEIWSMVNLSEEAHPIHIHDAQFQILSRNGVPPEAHEMGWKDTVLVKTGERVDVIKSFHDFADPDAPFMYHCHILEHEDSGMMGQYITVRHYQLYLPLLLR